MVFQQQRAAVRDGAVTASVIKSATKPQQSRCELLLWEGKRAASIPPGCAPSLRPHGRGAALRRAAHAPYLFSV